jgi:hypothetical protein
MIEILTSLMNGLKQSKRRSKNTQQHEQLSLKLILMLRKMDLSDPLCLEVNETRDQDTVDKGDYLSHMKS